MNFQTRDLNKRYPIDSSQIYSSFEIFELKIHLSEELIRCVFNNNYLEHGEGPQVLSELKH